MEIPLSTKAMLSEKTLWKYLYMYLYIYNIYSTIHLCGRREQPNQVFRLHFISLLLYFGWLHVAVYSIHFYELNRRRILIFLVARNPIPNFVLSMNVSIFSFIFIFFLLSFISFKRVHINCCLCYQIVSAYLCVRVFIYIFILYVCLCAFLFCFVISFFFFLSRIRPSALAVRDYSIFIHIVTYRDIYKIILARLHTCINKRMPNIHINGFGYALLMSVFACISFSLLLEVAKNKTFVEQFSAKNWFVFFVYSVLLCVEPVGNKSSKYHNSSDTSSNACFVSYFVH